MLGYCRLRRRRGVPWRMARELEKASDGAGSVGHVFNTHIRDQFRFKRAA